MPRTKLTPVKPTPASGRRPMRPIDREKMVPWLRNILDKNMCPGVRYINKDRTTFEIPWKHAAIRNYSSQDGKIFEDWAVHTKKYIRGMDKERDPKRWKANFRCAMNSLPDVEREKGTSSKGTQAVRRYRFLSQQEVKARAKKISGNKGKSKRTESSSEDACLGMEREAGVDHRKYQALLDTESETGSTDTEGGQLSPERIPNFEMIYENSDTHVNQHVSQVHLSGGRVVSNQMMPTVQTFLQPHTPESQPDSPSSLGLNSDVSEDDCMEYLDLGSEEDMILHPKYWSDEPFANVAAEVELSDDVSDGSGFELTALSPCQQI